MCAPALRRASTLASGQTCITTLLSAIDLPKVVMPASPLVVLLDARRLGLNAGHWLVHATSAVHRTTLKLGARVRRHHPDIGKVPVHPCGEMSPVKGILHKSHGLQ